MRIYPPLNGAEKISPTDFSAEFETHAELFLTLKKEGFDVKAQLLTGRRKGYLGVGSQFDLVVFKKKKALAIIEIKSQLVGPEHDLEKTEQGFKYRCFGVPVVLFWDMSQYGELKKFLKNKEAKSELSPPPPSFQKVNLERLYRLLDRCAMAAYDASLTELETHLEEKRDEIRKKMESV